VDICVKRFDELTLKELYEIISLRESVFVVEQDCVYLDADGKDMGAYHVIGREDGRMIAYLRVMDTGVSFDDAAAIGRVLALHRRQGHATQLLREGIRTVKEKFGAARIRLDAQVYARSLYEKHGFVQTSDEFLEDGLPHIQMTLEL